MSIQIIKCHEILKSDHSQ